MTYEAARTFQINTNNTIRGKSYEYKYLNSIKYLFSTVIGYSCQFALCICVLLINHHIEYSYLFVYIIDIILIVVNTLGQYFTTMIPFGVLKLTETKQLITVDFKCRYTFLEPI